MDSGPMRSGVSAADTKAYAAAVADTSRPAADSARDADRKPAETLAFAHLKPGQKVADFASGSGYFTRLFSDVVGPKGRVYSIEPSETQKYSAKYMVELQAYTASHPNVTLSTASALDSLKFPEPLDLFWISQNYHDLKDKFFGPVDTAAFNKAVFAALKPGGVYIVLDHAALSGAPADVTETLHRIDPAVVRHEVEAAGFKFESQSDILANPADPHTANVFDKTIRAHTDQFIYKFRKPKN
jgi:predicted methyltransferase